MEGVIFCSGLVARFLCSHEIFVRGKMAPTLGCSYPQVPEIGKPQTYTMSAVAQRKYQINGSLASARFSNGMEPVFSSTFCSI